MRSSSGPAMKTMAIGLGELLWDLFPTGKKLGGAPANFAYHMHLNGAESVVVSSVGADDLGDEIIERLAGLSLTTRCVHRDPEYPTGTVTVHLDSSQTATYTIHESVAFDNIPFTKRVRALCEQADVVCFGSLCQRSPVSRETIRSVLRSTRGSALRVFDVNLRQNYYNHDIIHESLLLANVLKLNDEELPIVASLLGIHGPEATVIDRILDTYRLQLVVLTRGASGSTLAGTNERSELPGETVQVVDTVGAGDAFTAAIVWGLMAGMDLEALHRRAARIASYVCTQRGGTPKIPDALFA